jgi:hypothetical protein
MKAIIEKAKKELQEIEYQNRTWESKFMKQQSIWDEIAMQINSYTGEEQKYWGLVMDLYHQKYS